LVKDPTGPLGVESVLDMAELIDGKAVAAKVRAEIAAEAKALHARQGVVPGIALVRVGEDPASKTYVGSKKKAAQELGFKSWEHHLEAGAPAQSVLGLIAELNAAKDVHGILVQLPLPPQIKADAVIAAIAPEKDVDGFHPMSAGNLFLGRPGFRPCTPAGVMRLLDEYRVVLSGKRAVVVGRSAIVGKPMAMLLLERDATVTICHRKSELSVEVARADVVVAAVGVRDLIRGEWIKPGAAVVDVGQNRTPEGKLCGDVEFGPASERAALITPVPGGVGPMTVAMLMHNTLKACAQQT
jgi:methylenetetrahydrofolate dehydrogenase (NADP+) / methenyltetrahydrofolate cyclohydrolase